MIRRSGSSRSRSTVRRPGRWPQPWILEVAAAYDVAQDRAARQIVVWLAEYATTRVGPRDRQVQVPVEEIEAAVVRHYTSRAGDPHRHLHLQINARVWAQGRWRGLHTVGVRDSLEAINGIGHAAVMCDPEFRTVLAAHGYTLDPESGEITELAKHVGAFSARARQIEHHVDSYEAAWRADHPGEEPGPTLRRAWDRGAWAQARPGQARPQRWRRTDGTVGRGAPRGRIPPTRPARADGGGAAGIPGPRQARRDCADPAGRPPVGVEPGRCPRRSGEADRHSRSRHRGRGPRSSWPRT